MLTHLDLDLVRAFVVVAAERSFSRAGERLLRTQSAISLQIKRLETAVGRRLLDRSPRSVALTPEGEVFLTHARRLLELNDEVLAHLAGPTVSGSVRLGTPEDFATTHLSRVLARFAEAYPAVALEVTCDLTLNLLSAFRTGSFDVVLVKREPSAAARGLRVWREPLVWVCGAGQVEHRSGALPLVCSPPPCVYRKRATEALTRAGRRWRIAYSCASLAGSLAAVRAGLGITVLPRDMVPSGLRLVDGPPLPSLDDTEIAMLSARGLSMPAQLLRDHIGRSLEQAGA
jgi:DNA-binding transcriptional LysR family regulator